MGDHTETFTIDGYWGDIKEICVKHLRGFGYRLLRDHGKFLQFEKGNLRKNIFTFSFEEAYKELFISLVGEEDAPVTTVSVNISLPFLTLRKGDIQNVKSFIRALREFIIVTLGFGRTTPRAKH